MDRCDPVKNHCCFKIVVQRHDKKSGRIEVAEFHNRPEPEARSIQHDFGPGSRSARREGWKITEITPMRCSRSARDLGRGRQRR
jgi:hypothetical protein